MGFLKCCLPFFIQHGLIIEVRSAGSSGREGKEVGQADFVVGKSIDASKWSVGLQAK